MFDAIDRLSIEFTKHCNFNCSYCHQEHSIGVLGFEELKKRVNFINSLQNINRNCLDITLTGGEVTTYPEDLERYFYYLKDNIVSKAKKFTLMSNMSNVDIVIKLLDDGILRKDRVGFSWDGAFNNQTRINKYSNEYFLDQIRKISETKYKDTVAFQVAITRETLPNLSKTISLLHDIGLTNLALYVINGLEYTDEDALVYDGQLKEISDLFIKSYIEDQNRLRLFSIHKCFRDYVVRGTFELEDTTRCRKIGQALHFTMDGGIYPCIYFGDHGIMKIGSLSLGLDRAQMNKFTEEYYKTPECISKCNLKHCLSCPAVNYFKRGSFSKRDLSHCKMYNVEKKWFEHVTMELEPYITPLALREYWGRIYEPA